MEILSHEQQVQKAIDAFFRAAGMNGWRGPVNDQVAEVFTSMLLEAQKCLNDNSWAFRPEPGKSPVESLIFQIDMNTITRMEKLNQDGTCLEFVVEKWVDKLNQAALAGRK